MTSFIRIRNWLRGKAPPILISLCVVGVSFLFVPDLGRFVQRGPVPGSILFGNYAPVPVAFGVGDNLHRVSRADGITSRKVISLRNAVVSSQTSWHSIPSLYGILKLNGFDTIFKRDFQQACRLLDIPPPPFSL